MRAHKKHNSNTIKISLLSISISQIIIQGAYATCAQDNSNGIRLTQGSCTASLNNYSNWGTVIQTSGDNTSLTLLDNTTISNSTNQVSGRNTIFLNGTNNSTVTAQNLTIISNNYSQFLLNGMQINPGNTFNINGSLEMFGPNGGPGYNTIQVTGGSLNISGNLTYNNLSSAGIGVSNNGTMQVLGNTNIITQNYPTLIISTQGTAIFKNQTYLEASINQTVDISSGGMATFEKDTTIKSGSSSLPAIITGENSTINFQKSLTLTSSKSSGIQNSGSVDISNIVNSSTFKTLLNNSGNIKISELLNSSSSEGLINITSGSVSIGTGDFTSTSSSISINTDTGKTSDITIGSLKLKNNSNESINLSAAGNNTITLNKSEIDSYGSLIKSHASYSGETLLTLNQVNISKVDNLIFDTTEGSGQLNINTKNTNLTGTTLSGGSTLSILLENSDWTLNDSTNNHASFDKLTIDSGSILKKADKPGAYDFSLTGNINNAGLIDFTNNTELGDTLTITGDYVGNNGTVELNTQLAGDNSTTDKLIINGSATGSTALKFNNINGQGSFTRTGIQVVQTDTSAAKAFYLPGGYLSAGEYEYVLSMRNENAQDNWYLGSALLPQPPVDPNNPQPPAPGPEDYIYSPNPGSMIALQQAANTLFNSQLEDREGASTQWLTSDGQYNVWLRAYGSSNQYNALYKQLHTEGRSLATQLGVGLVSLGDQEQFNLGLLAGYGRFSSDTHSRITQRKSSSELDGYSIGAYATWYKDPSSKQGFYADSWLLWNHFDNTLKLADGHKYDFKSKGVTASVEVGSHYRLAQGESINWWLQPQAQVIFEGVKADKRKDALGVTAKSGKHNVQTRLGAKTYLEVPVAISEQTQYRPYLELNWLHNTNPHSIVINNNTYHADGARNQGEVKLGLEGNFAENGLIWADAGYISGSQQNRTVQGTLGIKFNF